MMNPAAACLPKAGNSIELLLRRTLQRSVILLTNCSSSPLSVGKLYFEKTNEAF